ncbi:MAG: WYL domain-containing protein [Lachnospiraceae bacterium]|nr:WYL domain-containing protein [Lachnospiraceae bacterium]
MAEFSELIKKFDKIRTYMRDFYVYGFKSRADFTKKSARTYDNEKRRCESYLGEYMKWDYSGGNKSSFISVDCAKIPLNPLYAAWKSKSFTSNDIILHFYILDTLYKAAVTVNELTDAICAKSEITFDVQTVRNKLNEYVKSGMLVQKKQGKAFVYDIAPQNIPISPMLLDAIKLFQGAAPFGEIGSYLLDNENQANDLFAFKHYYIAHTLDSGVLYDLLSAMRQGRAVIIENQSERSGNIVNIYALPLKIFVSAATGRRYVCVYSFKRRRFTTFRLDYLRNVTPEKEIDNAEELKEKLNHHLSKVWSVSFGNSHGLEVICMKLHIDERREQYIIDRIKREGQGGELNKLTDNTFLYTKESFFSSDMTPWIKTFIGRIIGLEGTNQETIRRFYSDLERMAEMYGGNG